MSSKNVKNVKETVFIILVSLYHSVGAQQVIHLRMKTSERKLTWDSVLGRTETTLFSSGFSSWEITDS